MEAREIVVQLLMRDAYMHVILDDQIGGEELLNTLRVRLAELSFDVLGFPREFQDMRAIEDDPSREFCHDFIYEIWFEAYSLFREAMGTCNAAQLYLTWQGIAEVTVSKLTEVLGSELVQGYIAKHGLNHGN